MRADLFEDISENPRDSHQQDQGSLDLGWIVICQHPLVSLQCLQAKCWICGKRQT